MPAPLRPLRPAPPGERRKWAVTEADLEGAGLAALGLASSDELFASEPALSPRQDVLERARDRTRVRFPLPGTADLRGNLTGRPGPLGTGWLWLTSYRSGLGALLAARLTHPRSLSLAEREWNLLCHLRAHGVATPEPLLVGARGLGLVSRRSFLLVRAPEDALQLPRWLRTDAIGPERARGLAALAALLARLVRARVELPELAPEHLWITPSGSGECEAQEGPGLRKNKLPGVTLVEVRGGKLGARPARAPVLALIAALAPACSEEECAALARAAGP